MKSDKSQNPDPLYICPMHAGERSNEPGKCGICWMPLELVHGISLDSPTWYYCPDHPEPQFTDPARCPKCGKDLQRLDS